MSATVLTIAVIDQGTATLVAAIVAALASMLSLVPKFLELREERKEKQERQRLLVEELSGGKPMRSYEVLTTRLGMSEREIASMLTGIRAHGVFMKDKEGRDIKGVALNSRHQVGS
jgi:biotin operon repressor